MSNSHDWVKNELLAVVVRSANDNSALKAEDFDLFSGLVLERSAVGGTHNSGKKLTTFGKFVF